MVSEMAVGDGDASGPLDNIDQTISTSRHGNVINPDIGRTEDGDAISVALSPKTDMVLLVHDHPSITLDNIVNMESMDDHIPYKLDHDPCTPNNTYIGSPGIYGLIARHNQLLVQPYNHAPCKIDP